MSAEERRNYMNAEERRKYIGKHQLGENSMNKNKIKQDEDETVAVLLHIPKTLYQDYLKVINKKSMKRQKFSSDLFCEAITKLIEEK
jgi:hypothetical protein